MGFRNFIAAAPLVLIALEVLARAGGGGSYGGGGGTSFSGGGGSGGDIAFLFDLIAFLLRLCIHKPLVGIPLTLVLGSGAFFYFKYMWEKSGDMHKGVAIRRARRLGEGRRAVSVLKSKDPAFNEIAFNQRVKMAFLKIQNAWCKQNLKDVHAFISDGVDERFRLQFEEQRQEGYRDHMQNIQIKRCFIAQLSSDENFDVITVEFAARCIDYRVGVKDGKYISGSRNPQEFVEFWSFIRRKTAQTKFKNGLIEGNCPNCGVLLELNQQAKCSSCGSYVRSGQYDWVLAEITQASEWMPRHEAGLPGVAEYMQSDANFSPQQVEDRASVMFWRIMTSYRENKIRALGKIANEAFAKKFAGESLAPGQFFPIHPAVGAVEFMGLLRDGSFDTALVKIRWSAITSARENGKVVAKARKQIRTNIMVMKRKSGVSTKAEIGMSSAHCPSCGAPESDSASHSCDYCGAVLNDGSVGWVLDNWSSGLDPAISTLVQKLGPAKVAPRVAASSNDIDSQTNGALLAWMATVMTSNSKVSSKELKLLEHHGKKIGLRRDQVNEIIKQAQRGEIDLDVPDSPNVRRAWFSHLVEMALADGFLDRKERSVLKKFAARIGMIDYDVKYLIKKKRYELYKRSKMKGKV